MKVLAGMFALAAVFAGGTASSAEATLEYGRLDLVTMYQPAGTPQELVLFISGDGGWTSGVMEMARHLADQGALVAGVDVNQFGKRLRESGDSCIFTAGDLEGFAHFLENKYGFQTYVNPILVGYSSGATLAYTTLVQAPRGTFKGALSLGFCPDPPWDKPMCAGNGPGLKVDRGPRRKLIVHPASGLADPWIAMQGTIDQVCDASVTREFVAQVPGARLIELPKVGHGFSVERNYVPQYLDAFAKLASVPPASRPVVPTDISDLPLTEVPAHAPEKDLLAVMLSGDGGWAGLDRDVAAELAAAGVPVVGWDSLRYFWKARTPDQAAQDLDRVIRHYTRTWQKTRVVVVGYSMGADTMPFMVNRLPAESREKLALMALLAPGQQAFFEFHVQLWLGQTHGGLPVAPEMQRLSGKQVLCVYGQDEKDSLCAGLPAGTAERARLPGGHHFDGNYRELAARILQAVSKRT